jgi:hypothetical protein
MRMVSADSETSEPKPPPKCMIERVDEITAKVWACRNRISVHADSIWGGKPQDSTATAQAATAKNLASAIGDLDCAVTDLENELSRFDQIAGAGSHAPRR